MVNVIRTSRSLHRAENDAGFSQRGERRADGTSGAGHMSKIVKNMSKNSVYIKLGLAAYINQSCFLPTH